MTPKKTRQYQKQIIIKIRSHNQISKKSIKILTEEHDLKIQSFVSLKKQNKVLLSLISGPHVHKKSRDQYILQGYTIFYTINIYNNNDWYNFLEYKKKLYTFCEPKLSGFSSRFTYVTKEDCKLFF